MVFGRCCKRRVLGMERQRDKSLEAVRVVLQRAQLQQVIDAVFVVLDVAVEHGGIRLQARPRCAAARRSQPVVAINLVIADDVPHAVGENFRAAAGHGVEARVFQLHQHLARRHLAELAKNAISTMVKAFRCTCGKRFFRPEIRSR